MANNNNKQRQRKNTFDRMIMEYGEDGIDSIRSDKMQRYAAGIIKDIAFGNIRYEEQGQFFLNDMLMNALDYVLTIKLQYQTSIKTAMDAFITSPNFPSMPPMEQQNMNVAWGKCTEVYQILITLYNAVRYTMINKGDVSALFSVPVQIQKYRSSINDI